MIFIAMAYTVCRSPSQRLILPHYLFIFVLGFGFHFIQFGESAIFKVFTMQTARMFDDKNEIWKYSYKTVKFLFEFNEVE